MCISICIYLSSFRFCRMYACCAYVFIAHSIDQRQEIQFTTLLCEMSPHKTFLLLYENGFLCIILRTMKKFRFFLLHLLPSFSFFSLMLASDPLFIASTHKISRMWTKKNLLILWSNLLILVVFADTIISIIIYHWEWETEILLAANNHGNGKSLLTRHNRWKQIFGNVV